MKSNALVRLYATHVIEKKRLLSDIPESIREQVKEEIEKIQGEDGPRE